MKCPKCAYVGFAETDRCRHCGYDFSLSIAAPVALVVASPEVADAAGVRAHAPDARAEPLTAAADIAVGGEDPPADSLRDLPLRTPAFPVLVHETQPPPARTPLAVRRAAADRPRSRSTPHVVRRAAASLLDVVPEAGPEDEAAAPAVEVAPSGLRLTAALVDLLVLGGIDLAVVYLTAQLAGLPIVDAVTLPLVPLGAFLLGLNVAYLTVFTASGGQTLGKMATGLRVVAVSGGLTPGDAVLRVGVTLAGIVLAGAGFLPALVRADGRALHDYVARTRVVKVGT